MAGEGGPGPEIHVALPPAVVAPIPPAGSSEVTSQLDQYGMPLAQADMSLGAVPKENPFNLTLQSTKPVIDSRTPDESDPNIKFERNWQPEYNSESDMSERATNQLIPPGGGPPSGGIPPLSHPDAGGHGDEQEVARRNEAERLANQKQTLTLQRNIDGILKGLEESGWNTTEAQTEQFDLPGKLQVLTTRSINHKTPRSVPIQAGAIEVPDEKGPHSGYFVGGDLDPSYGKTKRMIVSGPDGEKATVQAVYLGSDKKGLDGKIISDVERKLEGERIDKYLSGVYARRIFGYHYNGYFHNRVVLTGLTEGSHVGIFASEFLSKHFEALMSLPCLAEDNNEKLESKGEVEFKNENALSQIMIAAMVAMEARGKCERPKEFKQFVESESFKKFVTSNPEVFLKWFGSPDGLPAPDNEGNFARIEGEWGDAIDPDKWDKMTTEERSAARTEDTVKGEVRGPLAEDNIFARDYSEGKLKQYKKDLIDFFGGSATAEVAVNLALMLYRSSFMSDMTGYEYFVKVVTDMTNEKGLKVPTLIVKAPMGGLASTAQELIRTREAIHFFRQGSEVDRGSRGGYPRAIDTKDIKSFSADFFRLVKFATTKSHLHPDRKASLYDLLFIDGVWPQDLPLDDLAGETPVAPGSLRSLMGAGLQGSGSYEKTKAQYPQTDPMLIPNFWQSFWGREMVGINADVVYWQNVKDGNDRYPDEDEVLEYKFDKMRQLIDAIVAEPLAGAWDAGRKIPGTAPSAIHMKGSEPAVGIITHGLTDAGEFPVLTMIDIANEAVPGLNYKDERLALVRSKFWPNVSGTS